ncbi:MAG: tetratricopeptide repeat protein [Alphaproteobacteria bacterium]|nr:tetratricopeptide repeat protein [Alphaproteobacteria bacterium]
MAKPAVQQQLEQAMARHRGGDLGGAAGLYQQILQTEPDNADALHLLGVVARQTGKHALARELIDRSLAINPRNPAALANKALTLREQKDYAAAIDAARAALAIDPEHAEAFSNLAGAQFAQGQYALAADTYRAALRSHPRDGNLLQALAAALVKTGELAEAHGAIKRALAVMPGNARCFNTLGNVLRDAGRIEEAIEAWRQAQAADPAHQPARVSEAMAHMLLGSFAAGLPLYEARGVPDPRYDGLPFWDGGALDGKTILLRAEQGFGDTLQFIRYVPEFSARAAAAGGKLAVEVQAALLDICRPLAPQATWLSPRDALPQVNAQYRLLSLPLLFAAKTGNIPAHTPYLASDANRRAAWKEKLAARPGPQIALTWAGNPGHLNDHNRSLQLETLAPLLDRFAPHILLLQKGFDTKDMLARWPALSDAGKECADFSDTAALLDCCDLLVAVDTAPVHLAGALARPAWVLLPYCPDWRWMRGRTDSPWYPGMRLFRQRAPRDWSVVMADVTGELEKFVGGDRSVLAPPAGAALQDAPPPAGLG